MAQNVGKEVLESIFQKISEQLKSEKTLDAERLLTHVYNKLMRDGKDQTVFDAFRAHHGRLIDLLVGNGGGHAWLQWDDFSLSYWDLFMVVAAFSPKD